VPVGRAAPRGRPPRKGSYDEVDGGAAGSMSYIRKEFMEEFVDNTNRRELGVGFLGRCLGLRRREKIDADIQDQLDTIGPRNPYRQVLTSVYSSFLLVVGCITSCLSL